MANNDNFTIFNEMRVHSGKNPITYEEYLSNRDFYDDIVAARYIGEKGTTYNNSNINTYNSKLNSQYSVNGVDSVASTLSGVSGLISSLAGVGLGIGQLVQNKKAMEFQKEQFEYNKEIEQRNFDFALEQQNYDRQLQQTIFEREDTAFQRAVSDLTSVGLSKTLLGSGASAGSIVTSSVPQQKTVPTPNTFLDFSVLTSALSTLHDAALRTYQTKAEIDLAYKNYYLKKQQNKTLNSLKVAGGLLAGLKILGKVGAMFL